MNSQKMTGSKTLVATPTHAVRLEALFVISNTTSRRQRRLTIGLPPGFNHLHTVDVHANHQYQAHGTENNCWKPDHPDGAAYVSDQGNLNDIDAEHDAAHESQKEEKAVQQVSMMMLDQLGFPTVHTQSFVFPLCEPLQCSIQTSYCD